jgi:hypothetical protein
MVQSDIELEFRPEVQAVCLLLDSPILITIIILSYLCVNVFMFLPKLMLFVMLGSMVIWIAKFIQRSRKINETEVKVFTDRVEIEVGLNNPQLTMIEFINMKEVKSTQNTVQRLFNTYNIEFVYKSEFDEHKYVTYVLRDFKDPNPICGTIRKAVDQVLYGKKK